MKTLIPALVFVCTCGCWHPCTGAQKDDTVKYYTFEIDGRKVGYYEESDRDGVLVSNAKLVMDGQAYENPFGIKHEGTKVTAYRIGDADWVDFKEAADVFPTSALPLLVPLVRKDGAFTYTQFIEGKAAVGKRATLKWETEERLVEVIDGQPGRRVVVRDGVIVEYGWGGSARSVLCKSKAEAVSGTKWE